MSTNMSNNMSLTSRAFSTGSVIPNLYTCDGKNISPPLAWSGLPPQTKSLALIVDDPDAPDPAAPERTWVHWVLYNIPATTSSLTQGIHNAELPGGTMQGCNDWERTGYGGPCPPIGQHRYFHKLYALDVVLPDLGAATKTQLLHAMQGHIIGQAELIGLYQR
jgi:Raf kinase inhibitor-like YbhB/YbcL family protein